MKRPFYKFAYGVVSRLSDLSGGVAVFVRWKVALAAIILGFSAGTLTGCEPTCYDQAGYYATDQQEDTDQDTDQGESNEQ